MKQPPAGTEARIAKMSFATVYPLYLARLEKNGRTRDELNEVIEWLTGYDEATLNTLMADEVTFETFFSDCTLNPNAHLIKGVVCGYRIEDLESPLIRQCRYLDKLVDELARGRKMDKILRADPS